MNGDQFPLELALSGYLVRWYEGLYPDTRALQEFVGRGVARAIKLAPGRMVDEAEKILQSYQRDENAAKGQNAKLPLVAIAMAKDYMLTTADWGGRQVSRRLVRIEEGGSVYGYRQAMYDVRAQVVIFAAEKQTARSLAAQLALFIGDVKNRRFTAMHRFGQYQVPMPVMLETPDVDFVEVKTEQNTITILAGDLNLKALIPYFDAPRDGEESDGTTNDPQGYPVAVEVGVLDLNTNAQIVVSGQRPGLSVINETALSIEE